MGKLDSLGLKTIGLYLALYSRSYKLLNSFCFLAIHLAETLDMMDHDLTVDTCMSFSDG